MKLAAISGVNGVYSGRRHPARAPAGARGARGAGWCREKGSRRRAQARAAEEAAGSGADGVARDGCRRREGHREEEDPGGEEGYCGHRGRSQARRPENEGRPHAGQAPADDTNRETRREEDGGCLSTLRQVAARLLPSGGGVIGAPE